MANRSNIYYWKCDRANAFFALEGTSKRDTKDIDSSVEKIVGEYFGNGRYTLSPAGGQGNHITYKAETSDGERRFIRVENGPEKDDYMEVEARAISEAGKLGIPVPVIYAVDSSRIKYPFAYQIMENLEYPNLNELNKRGELELLPVMRQLGKYIARWQTFRGEGFGPFDAELLRSTGRMEGLHASYAEYYRLNLVRHLDFIVDGGLVSRSKADEILCAINSGKALLDAPDNGCLVHKDIALWNIVGDSKSIKYIIDWDDCILGDPTDDISLMACFHSGAELSELIDGYVSGRSLPENFEMRFWLHLMRNILFKSVIRVGAGYFNKGRDFFLVGENGDQLRKITLDRMDAALKGLQGKNEIYNL